MVFFALDDAASTTIVLLLVFAVLFPALVTGLIVYAIAIARGEGMENDEERRYPKL